MTSIVKKIITDTTSVFVIAEAGVNHNGSLEIARKLIDTAVKAGADAVKFQTFKAEDLVTRVAKKAGYQEQTTNPNETQYELLKKLELNYDQHSALVRYCREKGIIFLSTPFDQKSVDLLEQLDVPAYKISSGDLNNLPFLKYVAQKGKLLILSTGMSNLGEVEEAIEAVQKTGNNNLVLLHCTSNYPTAYDDVNLKAMITLKNAFHLPIGYSDHTLGIDVPIAAVALGAKVIEKHFTLDKNLPGPDHQASLDPKELKLMVESIRHIETALGNGLKKCTITEEYSKHAARKSIVAASDIPAGVLITEEMLAIKRPGTGLPPKFMTFLIGRRTKHAIPRDTVLDLALLE